MNLFYKESKSKEKEKKKFFIYLRAGGGGGGGGKKGWGKVAELAIFFKRIQILNKARGP